MAGDNIAIVAKVTTWMAVIGGAAFLTASFVLSSEPAQAAQAEFNYVSDKIDQIEAGRLDTLNTDLGSATAAARADNASKALNGANPGAVMLGADTRLTLPGQAVAGVADGTYNVDLERSPNGSARVKVRRVGE